jgi:hypothetical protein
MKPARTWALLALALCVSSCHDETTIINNAASAGVFSAPVPIAIGALDDAPMAVDTGSDGQPRLVFTRGQQVLFTRRNSDGTWTTPLDLSADDASGKADVRAVVSRNNDFTHVVWRDAAGIHYARVNNAAIPVVDLADAVISGVMPSNVTAPAAGFGGVSTPTLAIDRALNNVYVAWPETLDPDTGDANGGDQVPVVAAVAAGAGAPGERFALVLPTSDATGALNQTPLLRVSGTSVVHALWAGALGDGTGAGIRHRVRTAASTWSSDPNGQLVHASLAASATDLLLAPDGDAYAILLDGAAGLALAAYRAVGVATSFAAAQTLDAATHVGFVAALEPGTEILHGMWHDGVAFVSKSHSAANLAGTWPAVPTTVMANAATGGVATSAWADSTNRVVFAFQGDGVAGGANHVFATSRPTGATGAWAAPSDLTAGYSVPNLALSVATNATGDAVLTWTQGDPHVLPLADLFGVSYTAGGVWSLTENVSSSATGTHGPLVLHLADTNVGDLFWLETAVTDTSHNIYHSRKP